MKKKAQHISKATATLVGLSILAALGLLIVLISFKQSQDIRQQASENIAVLPITLSHSPETPVPGENVVIDFSLNTYGVEIGEVQLSFEVKTRGEQGTFTLKEGTGLEASYLEVTQTTSGYEVSVLAIPTQTSFSTNQDKVIGSFSYLPQSIETTEISFHSDSTHIFEYNTPIETNLVGTLDDYLLIVGNYESCQEKPACLDHNPPCNILYYPDEGWCNEQSSASPSATQTHCVAEGQYGYTEIAEGAPIPSCCSGLVETLVSEKHQASGSASQCVDVADVFVCAQCGNGICGPGENDCNCSSDCGLPTEPPSNTSFTASISAFIATDESRIALHGGSETGPHPSRILEIHPIKLLMDFGQQLAETVTLSIDSSRLLFTENSETVAALDLAVGSKCALHSGETYADIPFELSLDDTTLSISASQSAYFPANHAYLVDYQLTEGDAVDRKVYAFTTRSIAPFVTDITGDQTVDIDDYSVLAGELLTTEPNYFYADFDCSGIVDIDDYTIMTRELFSSGE